MTVVSWPSASNASARTLATSLSSSIKRSFIGPLLWPPRAILSLSGPRKFSSDSGSREWHTAASPERKVPAFSSFSGKGGDAGISPGRSEEHTSELQSRGHLVCRLLLEKKKKKQKKKKTENQDK